VAGKTVWSLINTYHSWAYIHPFNGLFSGATWVSRHHKG